ncbi:MAG: CapA family protein [Oscillospiraceae bacterium]|nr:CapA family protein [Oscillospiraceae bacterium]
MKKKMTVPVVLLLLLAVTLIPVFMQQYDILPVITSAAAPAPALVFTADPTPLPAPTEDTEIASAQKQKILSAEAVRVLERVLPPDIPAAEFLLMTENELWPDAAEELAAVSAEDDVLALLTRRTGESPAVLRDRFFGLFDSPEKAAESNVYFADSSGSGKDTILAFVGDVNFSDEIYYVMQVFKKAANGLSGIFTGGLLETMRAADVLMPGNEFAFTSGGAPLPGKTYSFRSPPETVRILADMGANIAFLANNHVFDYGPEGLSDTLKTLREAGIPPVGAGMDINEASQPVYYIVKGKKIAFVAAGCIERYGIFTPGASEAAPGIFRTDEKDPEALKEVIKAAAENSDFVVVYFHWGVEGSSTPEPYQRELARISIEAGADAVLGSHPHVLQGAEFHNGKPIIYSLGNFWFGLDPRDTCLLELILDEEGGAAVRFRPCVTASGKTSLAEGEAARRILRFYESISFGVEIDGEGFIRPREET